MKYVNPVFVVFICFLISCSSDDDRGDSIVSSKLVSITKRYYQGNNNFHTEKYNFFNERLINIQYSDDSYDDIYYEGDVISRILEFNSNNEWEWTITYAYDNEGRLINKKVIPSPFNTITDVSRQKNFEYAGNLIRSENSWSDGGFQRNALTINNENLIVEDQFLTDDGNLVQRYLSEYTNGNMTGLTLRNRDDIVTEESSYTYMDKAVTRPYQMNSYLFGNEWKNNKILSYQFGLSQSESYKFSDNYIERYSSNNFVTNISITGTFSYKFDSNDDIIEQEYTKSISTGDTFKTITTFEYE